LQHERVYLRVDAEERNGGAFVSAMLFCKRPKCRNRLPEQGKRGRPSLYCSKRCKDADRQAQRRASGLLDPKNADRARLSEERRGIKRTHIALRVRRQVDTPTDPKTPKDFNKLLAQAGLSLNAGEFLQGAPHGAGRLVHSDKIEQIDAHRQTQADVGGRRSVGIRRKLDTTTWGGKRVKIDGYSLNKKKEELPNSFGKLHQQLSDDLRNDRDGDDVSILDRMDAPKRSGRRPSQADRDTYGDAQ
jgi:hypothetical protein